jgi:hypothetical protein
VSLSNYRKTVIQGVLARGINSLGVASGPGRGTCVNLESVENERSPTFQGHRVLPDGLNSILRDDSLTAFENWRDADFFPLYGDLCEKSLN